MQDSCCTARPDPTVFASWGGAIGAARPLRTGYAGLLFDLNGTISDDEGLFYEVFAELFAAEGRPLTRVEYFTRFVGLTDDELVLGWLGEDFPRLDGLLQERYARFQARARDGSTIGGSARAAVRAAAARVPIGVVSGDVRDEIELLLRGAGLLELFSVVVSIEDVERPKPAPDQYLLALERLDLAADEVVAIEDTPVGVAAAKAAGLTCVAVLGTTSAERLAAADEIVPGLDEALVQRLLDSG